MSKELIEAGALRQFRHNDGSGGLVFAFDKVTTERYIAELKRDVEKAKQDALDAVRYRWLRDKERGVVGSPLWVSDASNYCVMEEELDKITDAAIAAEKEQAK